MNYLMMIIGGLLFGFSDSGGWKGVLTFLGSIVIGVLIRFLTK